MWDRLTGAICSALLGALLLFYGYLATHPSYRPTPSTGEQVHIIQPESTSRNDQAENYGRGTDKSPFVVKVQHAPTTEDEAEKDADYRERKSADNRVIWWSGAAVIVGFIQAVALFVTFAAVAFVGVTQLRAYIYPSVFGIKKFSLTEPIEIFVTVRNSGSTPAKNFESHGIAFVAAVPLPDNTRLKDLSEGPTERHSKLAIYPGTEQNADYRCVDILDSETILALKQEHPGGAIYVAGEATYRDIFHFRRRTTFCRFIEFDDTKQLIKSEETGRSINIDVRFTAAHILNDFS